MKLYAIVRLRGTVDVNPEVEATLRHFRLIRKYHCSLYPSTLPGIEGMLRKIEGWATWGEIDRETLIELLRARGRTPGNRRLTDEYVREKLGLEGGIEELADKLLKGELMLHKLENLVKPVFRLHPPKRGFRGSIKKMFGAGGELGYRGSNINDLLRRMI